ncbi:MAG: leucine-rich repeat protein [Clostridiales Family XIII bacterium]|nr:leucine-rich repeat protein [Clostridiales Family XIII bacterium]
MANYGAFESALLTQLTLDNLPNLEVIGNESFKKSPLESLTLTNLPKLQVIGERSFQNATSLTALDLSNLPALEIIGDNAFENAPIETLNLQGDTALKKICYRAFYKNRLTTVDLSGLISLEIIGSRAFSDGSAPGIAGGGGAAITSLNLSNTPSLKIIGSVDGGSLGDDYKKATYYLCGEGGRTFYGANLTSLDLSGCPNLESVGFAAFLSAPIEELDFTGLNRLRYIGMLAFASYAGTSLEIRDLPALYEIGGLAFSSGRVTSRLTDMTLENLPALRWLSEQQSFAYDADGNLVTDNQGYNTTHIGGTANSAYNKLTTLTLRNLPDLNCIPPHIFYASPLTSLTLEDLGIRAIGYQAFQGAKLTGLDLSTGLTELAAIDRLAFRDAPVTRLDALNLPRLRTIGAEAFYRSSLTDLDLTDSTEFLGFPTSLDTDGVTVLKRAFGDSSANTAPGSQLNFVLIGGIGADNATDSLYIQDDSAMSNTDQTFNKNDYVPVYVLGDSRSVVTQNGYTLNPVNIMTSYVYVGVDGMPGTADDVPLRPDRITRGEYHAGSSTAEVTAMKVFGYKLIAGVTSPTTISVVLPTAGNLADPDYVEMPTNAYTFYYEQDPDALSGASYHIYEDGITTRALIGNSLTSTFQISNGGIDAGSKIGAGWTVQVVYDPTRVLFQQASSGGGYYTAVNDPLAGVVTFTFLTDIPDGLFAPTLWWKLIPGRTEQERPFPLYVSLMKPDGTAVAEADPIVYLSGFYEKPNITKYASSASLTAKTWQDDAAVYDGGWLEEKKRYANPTALWVRYDFAVGNNKPFMRNIDCITYTDTLPTYIMNSIHDPELSAGGTQVTGVAAFDPARNPGWQITELVSLGGDGLYGTEDDRAWIYDTGPNGVYGDSDDFAYRDVYVNATDPPARETEAIANLVPVKVSYTFDNLCTMNPPVPSLVLDFPYAWEGQTFTNKVSFVADVYRPAFADDLTFSASDSIRTIISSTRPGNFVKWFVKPHDSADVDYAGDGLVPTSPSIPAGADDRHPDGVAAVTRCGTDGAVLADTQGWFYDSVPDKTGELVWTIGVSGEYGDDTVFPDGTYWKDIAFTDVLYDARLKYTAVGVGAFGPATVTAYGADGAVLYARAKVAAGAKVSFPAGIQEAIVRVTVTDSQKKIRGGETEAVTIYTMLKDPTLTWEEITANGTDRDPRYDPATNTGGEYFWNLGEADRTLVVTTTDAATGQAELVEHPPEHVDSWHSVRIHNLTEGLGISKKSDNQEGTYIAGKALNYSIQLDTYDGNNPIDCKNVSMVLEDVEIVDVIPPSYLFEGFTPSQALVEAASDDLAWVYEADGFTDANGEVYDVLRITAGSLTVSGLWEYDHDHDGGAKTAAIANEPRGGIGRVTGRINPGAGAQSVVNRVYLNYAPNASVYRVGTNTEDYYPEMYLKDGVTPNPDYGVAQIVDGLATGNHPFPGEAQVAVGTDVGETGITKQMVSQKSIRARSSASTWGQWVSSFKDEPMAGVSTGGVQAAWAYEFQYRLLISNNTDTTAREHSFKVYDVLPAVGDQSIVAGGSGVRSARDSEFRNTLKGVTAPDGYVVEYLLAPSGLEIPSVFPDADGTPGPSENDSMAWLDAQPDAPSPVSDFVWVAAPLVSSSGGKSVYDVSGIDETQIRAIRFLGGPSVFLDENKQLEIILDMQAPMTDVDVGMRAVNSFAWVCNIQPTLIEPPPVYNEILPFPASVRVTKVAAGTGQGLAGAVFGLYDDGGTPDDPDDDVLLQKKTSASGTGNVTFTGVAAGTYVVKEITAPAGYALNENSWKVTVLPKAVPWEYYVSAVPVLTTDGSYADAVGVAAGDPEPPGVAPVPDTPLPSRIELYKVALADDDTHSTVAGPLAGAVFGLYGDSGCTALLGSRTTDAAGYAAWEELAPGIYYVKEISAPTGYVLPSPVPVFAVEVKGGADHRDAYTIDYEPLTAGAADPVPNEPNPLAVLRGAILLSKVDGTDDAGALTGATFRISRAAVPEYQDARVNATRADRLQAANEWQAWSQTVTVGADGRVAWTGLLALEDAPPLADGVLYTIEETAAPGALQRVKLTVRVYPDRSEVEDVWYLEGSEWKPASDAGLAAGDLAYDGNTLLTRSQDVTVVDKLAPVKIMKLGFGITDYAAQAKLPTELVAADGTPLAGVDFRVYEEDALRPDHLGALAATGTTNAAGQIVFSSLHVGQVYILHEETLPEYYLDYIQRDTVFRIGADGAAEGFVPADALHPQGQWVPFDNNGMVTVGNIPKPVSAQLVVTKTETVPQAYGQANAPAAHPFARTQAVWGIRFYIDVRTGPGGDGVYGTDDDVWTAFTDPGADATPGTPDDVNASFIVTSDGDVTRDYDPATGLGARYRDNRGTLNPADDQTAYLAKGQALLAGLMTGTGAGGYYGLPDGYYRVREEAAGDLVPTGLYLPQTQVYEFRVNAAAAPAGGQSFAYAFVNTPVQPVMAKGDYVGTFDTGDSYENMQLATAYALLDGQGRHPIEMIRSDGRVDLIAGLGGAVFEMKDYASPHSTAASALAGTWLVTSNADGIFDFSTMVGIDGTVGSFPGFNEAHSYTFREVTPPAGYALNTTVTYYYPSYEAASMRANGGKWISLENRVPSHKLQVSKYAADTMESLAGTTFAVYYPDGTQVFTDEDGTLYPTFETDANGVLELPGLAPGTYYLKEVAAPAVDGDADYYEVKPGYYKVVIGGTTDVRAAALPGAAHQTDRISPFVDSATAGAVYGTAGDPSAYRYDGTDALNPDYAGPAAGGRASAWDAYTNAYNFVYPAAVTTEGDAYAVVTDARSVDPFTLTVAKVVRGNPPANDPDDPDDDAVFYFRVETSVDGGATWRVYGMADDGVTPLNAVYTRYLSDADTVGADDYTDAHGLIHMKDGEHATVSAGFALGTWYRMTEVAADGTPLEGWYASVTKTVPDDTVSPADADALPDVVDATPGYGSVPQDQVTGQLVVLDTHGDNATTDLSGANDEGHHVVTYANQKAVDFSFLKYADGGGAAVLPLAGTEFTLYRCAVLADGDASNDAGHVHAAPGDTGAAGYCWEEFERALADASGIVTFPDLRLYGVDANTNGTADGVPDGDPDYGVYLLAETGTLPGYEIPFGCWLVEADPFAATPAAQITLTAVDAGGLYPPAFELDDWDGDPATPDTYRVSNRRAPVYPLTGGTGAAPFVMLAGLLLVALALALRRRNGGSGRTILKSLIIFVLAAAPLLSAGPVYADAASGTGSLTIVKYAGAATGARATGDPIDPADNSAFFADTDSYRPLAGIEFEVTPVIGSGTAQSGVLYTDPDGTAYIRYSGSSLHGATQRKATGTDGAVRFDDLPLGTYLVREVPDARVMEALSDFLVRIPAQTGAYDVWVYPKNELISVRKSYSDDPVNRGGAYTGRFSAQAAQKGGAVAAQTSATDPNRLADIEQYGSANIGDVVEWDVASTVPGNIADLSYYTITDRYRPGLDVMADGIELWAFAADADAAVRNPMRLEAGVDYAIEVKRLTAADTALPIADGMLGGTAAVFDPAATYIYDHDELSAHAGTGGAAHSAAFAYLDGDRAGGADPYDTAGVTVIQYALTSGGMAKLAAVPAKGLPAYRTLELFVPTRLTDEAARFTELHNPAMLSVKAKPLGASGSGFVPLSADNPEPVELMAEHPEVHTGTLLVRKMETGTTTVLAGCTVQLVQRRSESLADDMAAQQAYNERYRGVRSPYVLRWDGTRYVDWAETTDAAGIATFAGVAYADRAADASAAALTPFRGYGARDATGNSTSSLAGGWTDYWIVEVGAPTGYALDGPWKARVSARPADAAPVPIYDPKLPGFGEDDAGELSAGAAAVIGRSGRTGDAFALPLWGLLAVVAAGLLCVLCAGHWRRRRGTGAGPPGSGYAMKPPDKGGGSG